MIGLINNKNMNRSRSMSSNSQLEGLIIKGKNIYYCFPEKNCAKIQCKREDAEIDYDLKLIDYLKDYKVTQQKSNGRHRISFGRYDLRYLYRVIYSFLRNENLEGFDIDHLDSNPSNNKIVNLIKLPKKLHDAKLKAIDQFYIPYTLNLGINHDTGNYILVLVDWGMDIDDKMMLSKMYERNLISFYEYCQVEDLINDLKFFMLKPKNYIKNDKVSKEDMQQISQDNLGMKIRLFSKLSKATRSKLLKLNETKFNQAYSIFKAYNNITNGYGKGKITGNEFILDFDIFDRTKGDLKKRGFIEL